MFGRLKIGDQIRTTHIRFRKIDDSERYINAIEQDYQSEGLISKGYI